MHIFPLRSTTCGEARNFDHPIDVDSSLLVQQTVCAGLCVSFVVSRRRERVLCLAARRGTVLLCVAVQTLMAAGLSQLDYSS